MEQKETKPIERSDQKTIKILVACHKESSVPRNSVYTPIHVGKALHPEKELDMIGDNTGENISVYNEYYCELTAQYWGWKNLECKYIGLAHYRRYFETEITEENIEVLMKGKDIILSKAIHLPVSINQFWLQKLIPEDITILYLILKQYYPEYYVTAERYLCGNRFTPCNMFVCRKDLFDEFAAWQFSVLERVRKIIPRSGYSRERRILGYMGEGLLPIWSMHNRLRVKRLPIVSRLGEHAYSSLRDRVHAIKRDIKKDMQYALHREQRLTIGMDYVEGLEADGIIEQIGKE